MKSLKHPDNLHLQAAQGWLELGNPLEADKTLDEIRPEMRAHPKVLLVRSTIYFELGKWGHLLPVAELLVEQQPKHQQPWIQRSYALHELKRTQEAFDKLLPAAKKFPKVWVIPYNLACYTAQLGRLEECKSWFKKAMILDERNVQREAIDDPDLKPLWDSMSGTLWGRT